MATERYYLEVDDEICFKAPDFSDEGESLTSFGYDFITSLFLLTESDDAMTPEGGKNVALGKMLSSSGVKRPALISIDQNVLRSCPRTHLTPQKQQIQASSSIISPGPALGQIITAEDIDEDQDGVYFEAREGPTEEAIDLANIENRPDQASVSKTPSKPVSKTPKSFLKKLLSWGSSTKYPPGLPIEKAPADTTADRMVGESEAVLTSGPDYLMSPPRDAARSNETEVSVAPKVNRTLLWQDDEPVDVLKDDKVCRLYTFSILINGRLILTNTSIGN